MRLALIGLLALGGCSTVSLNCPADHVVTANINGPDYAGLASQIVTLLSPYIATGGVVGAKKLAAAVPSQNDGTLTIKTLDFGTQSYSCGNANPPVPVPAPTPAALKAPAPESMQETPTPMAMAAPLPPMFVH